MKPSAFRGFVAGMGSTFIRVPVPCTFSPCVCVCVCLCACMRPLKHQRGSLVESRKVYSDVWQSYPVCRSSTATSNKSLVIQPPSRSIPLETVSTPPLRHLYMTLLSIQSRKPHPSQARRRSRICGNLNHRNPEPITVKQVKRISTKMNPKP